MLSFIRIIFFEFLNEEVVVVTKVVHLPISEVYMEYNLCEYTYAAIYSVFTSVKITNYKPF